MTDHESIIRDGLTVIDPIFQQLFGIGIETKGAADLLRTIMDPRQLRIYDLALQCETEMVRCNDVGAYFAGCLMGAAMNEALLSLMSLFYVNEVQGTAQYGWSTRKGKRGTFDEVVGSWKLEQLIKVAEELDWIPKTVVAPQFVEPLSNAYRELSGITAPNVSEVELDKSAASFRSAPGPTMLRMVQELRNSIHPGRWIRSGQLLNGFHFDGWCRIAIHVCGEIRNCLIHRITQKNVAMLTSANERLKTQMADLRARMLSKGCAPAEFDQIFEMAVAETLAQHSQAKEK